SPKAINFETACGRGGHGNHDFASFSIGPCLALGRSRSPEPRRGRACRAALGMRLLLYKEGLSMRQTRPIQIGSTSLVLFVALAFGPGCGSTVPTGPSNESVDSTSQDIIGGVDARSSSLDAIGVFLLSPIESPESAASTGTSAAST